MLIPDQKHNRWELAKKYPLFKPAGKRLKMSAMQVERLVVLRNDDSLKFWAIPSFGLTQMVMKRVNEVVRTIPQKMRKEISMGSPILIDQMMVINWACGKLDERNDFILTHCDIRVDGLFDPEIWKGYLGE